jgi:23S rRNA pseudouridine1911/1915/1917 synthase
VPQEKNYWVEEHNSGDRLDLFLTGQNAVLSRSRIQNIISAGLVRVNECPLTKAGYRLKVGDKIHMVIPDPERLTVTPEAISLEIVYEDADLLVVNKPQGMVVHPAAGNYQGTLVNALLYYCHDLSGINGVYRPGIVHRIDKDTSGLLVVTKNDAAHLALAAQIKEHRVKRVYVALVQGHIKVPSGKIDVPIGRHPVHRQKMAVTDRNAKRAITHFRVLASFSGYTLIEARLETGRTHQIRVHLAYLGHPIVGDPKYGSRQNTFALKGQALHAKILGFHHPRTHQYLEFEVSLPVYFQNLLEKIQRQTNCSP